MEVQAPPLVPDLSPDVERARLELLLTLTARVGQLEPPQPPPAFANAPLFKSSFAVPASLADFARRGQSHASPAPPPASDRAALKMVSDTPISGPEADQLRYGDYAEALAVLINNPETVTPLTIAINAPWGAGKSSLARLIEKRLTGREAAGGYRPHRVCWFNAWIHEDATNLAAAFAAAVARDANAGRSLWRRAVAPLPWSLLPPGARRKRKLLILAAGALALCVAFSALQSWANRTGLTQRLVADVRRASEPSAAARPGGTQATGAAPSPETPVTGTAGAAEPGKGRGAEAGELTPDDAMKLVNVLGLGTTALLLAFAYKVCSVLVKPLFSVFHSVAAYVRDPEAATVTGSMQEVREQLGRLIEHGTPKGSCFVIFVDDLERCKPPRSIELLEVVNQLLNHARVVTVLLADMPAVAACAAIKYEALARHTTDGLAGAAAASAHAAYGRDFLQKIVQVQFDVPPPDRANMEAMLDGLSADRLLKDEPAAAPPAAPAANKSAITNGNGAAGPETLSPASPAARLHTATDAQTAPPKAAAVLRGLAPPRGDPTPETSSGLLLGLLFIVGALQHYFPRYVQPGPAVTVVMLLVLGVAVWRTVTDERRKTELRQQRTQARQAIKDQAGAGTLDYGSLISNLRTAVSPSIVLEQFQIHRFEKSTHLEAARAEARKYVPPYPRHLKRLENQLRLQVYVAEKRGLFDADEEMERRMGKWIAIRERWPELAQCVLCQPALMTELEALADDGGEFRAGVAQLIPVTETFADLRACLRAEPKLGDAMPRLVHFAPPAEQANLVVQ